MRAESVKPGAREDFLSNAWRSIAGGKHVLLGAAILSLAAGGGLLLAAGKRYTSTATVLPASSGATSARAMSGELSGFDLMLLGIDDRRSLLPLYPDILRSALVSRDILERSYTFAEGEKRVTRTLTGHLGKKNVEAAAALLTNRIASFWLDRTTKTLVIQVTLDNPELASLVANAYVERLERFVRDDRRSAPAEVYAFVLRKLESSRAELREAEGGLADFRARNRNFDFAADPPLRMEHRRLMRRVQLAQAVCGELAIELERAAVEAGRDTPVLTVLDYGRVPERPSWPSPLRFILAVTLGGTLAASLALIGADAARRWRGGRDRETVERLLGELGGDIASIPLIGNAVRGASREKERAPC